MTAFAAEGAPSDSASATAGPDSVPPARKIVRQFPPTEVRALLPDMRSSETVRLIPRTVLRSSPVDALTDVVAMQAGVVAVGEELHVRGGRNGEMALNLDGLNLNEPLRRRAIDVPLLALRSADLVTGAPGAQYGGGLAGVLNLHSADPDDHLSGEWKWQSDGQTDTRFDRVGARIGTPLHALGLGALIAGDATYDDTWLPALRSKSIHRVMGLPFGWRAENRATGFLKLAPVRNPERLSAELLIGRQVHRPYSPDWTVDGWIYPPPNLKLSPEFSSAPLPGYYRYRAADHLAITDDRQMAAQLQASMVRGMRRGSLSLGWVRTRTITSLDGHHEGVEASHRPRYENVWGEDRYHVLWGDYSLYRESATDVVTLRGEGSVASKNGGSLTAGGGLTYDDVSLREMDWMPFAGRSGDATPMPFDSVRAYQAYAPGGCGYVQGRWLSAGLVLNTGLRVDYFTAGPQADDQTLPGLGHGIWSFAPRLGIAYPISVRDVFSLAYVRVHQAPGRDFLYDDRIAISDRQPLGNPSLGPATMISYQAAVKHLFGPSWALQGALYYRDVYHQVGTFDAMIPAGPINLSYTDDDQSHAYGFEWSVVHVGGERRRIEAHYVWMHASGNESRPEGDPYGPVRTARTPLLGGQPVSWDRTHSMFVSGLWDWRNQWSVAWSTSVGSPLPWTPKDLRQPFTDFALVNSRRLGWTENTNLNLTWTPPGARGLTFGIEARNLFDNRGERAATLDGYPNPVINTRFDDYGAYRTQTNVGGGAYWSQPQGAPSGEWIPVHDPRLFNPPRAIRASIGGRW